MKRILGGAAAVVVASALAWALGCSSGSSGGKTCTDYEYAPASGSAAYADTCTPVGGQCGAAGGATACPAGMRLDTTKTCGGGGYGYDPANNCGPAFAGPAEGYPAAAPCCMPIGDGGEDGGGDASDDGGDADAGPSKVGLCATETCNAGCSCGVLPQDGQPHCLCLGADGGAADAGSDAASSGPNCGTIYCFSGCSCRDFMSSACGCP